MRTEAAVRAEASCANAGSPRLPSLQAAFDPPMSGSNLSFRQASQHLAAGSCSGALPFYTCGPPQREQARPQPADGAAVAVLGPTVTHRIAPSPANCASLARSVAPPLPCSGAFTAANFVGPLSGKPAADFMQMADAGQLYINVHSVTEPTSALSGLLGGPATPPTPPPAPASSSSVPVGAIVGGVVGGIGEGGHAGTALTPGAG